LPSFLGRCVSGEVEKKTDTVAIENNNVLNEAEVVHLQLKEEIKSLKEQVKYIEEYKEYLMTLIKEIMEDLRDEAMLNFAQKQFKYELRINGEPILENEEVSVSAGELEIVIV
jgi:hypothetical protein